MKKYIMERQAVALKVWDEDNFVDVRYWDRCQGKTYLGMLCAYTEGMVKGNKVLVVSKCNNTEYLFSTLDTVHKNLLGLSGNVGSIKVISSGEWLSKRWEILMQEKAYSLFVFDQWDRKIIPITNNSIKEFGIGVVYCQEEGESYAL